MARGSLPAPKPARPPVGVYFRLNQKHTQPSPAGHGGSQHHGCKCVVACYIEGTNSPGSPQVFSAVPAMCHKLAPTVIFVSSSQQEKKITSGPLRQPGEKQLADPNGMSALRKSWFQQPFPLSFCPEGNGQIVCVTRSHSQALGTEKGKHRHTETPGTGFLSADRILCVCSFLLDMRFIPSVVASGYYRGYVRFLKMVTPREIWSPAPGLR